MARTALTVTTLLDAYGDYSAGAADVTLAAGDVGNGNDFTLQEGDIVIAQNSDGANPYYITIDSVADAQHNREGDITEYALAAADVAVFGPFKHNGWRQADGKMYIDVENAAVLVGILRQS